MARSQLLFAGIVIAIVALVGVASFLSGTGVQTTLSSSSTLTSLTSETGICKPNLPQSGPGSGNGTMSIVPMLEGPPRQPGLGSGSGLINWCIYGASGNLTSVYATNKVLGGEAGAVDGSSVAAVGWQLAPGPAGAEINGAIYFFDKEGQMQWNLTSSQPFFSISADSNNSVIVVNDPQLLYINSNGRILWNYSQFETMDAVLLDNGSRVVVGVNEILYPNHLNFGSALTMFDSKGTAVWNVTLPDYDFDCGDCLATSGGHLVAGLSVSGYNGTVAYYDLQGNLVWSRYVDSAIIMIAFENGGSTIYAQTNWGSVTFDLSGNVLSNQTAPH
jgi:hypothetical protein